MATQCSVWDHRYQVLVVVDDDPESAMVEVTWQCQTCGNEMTDRMLRTAMKDV